MLLTLRGTPVLYQGDEIGLGNVEVPHALMRDPLGVRYFPHYSGRDARRTPMHWADQPGGGFTEPDTTPWLPLGDTAAGNVESQRGDHASILELTRALMALRKRTPDLHSGSYATIPTRDEVWAWQRGTGVAIAMNLSHAGATIEGLNGRVLLGSVRTREGEAVSGVLALQAWEAVIIES